MPSPRLVRTERCETCNRPFSGVRMFPLKGDGRMLYFCCEYERMRFIERDAQKI